METIRTLAECEVEVIGGQIMSRVTARTDAGEESVQEIKVVIPKCIHADGTIDAEEMATEQLKTTPDPKKLTEVGDIVIKLSTPYDAAMVDEESAGCIIPSFCAIVKNTGTLDPKYLLAFLNSETCKKQLKMQVSGVGMTVLSVGKVKELKIPVPPIEYQHYVGEHFIETQRKIKIVRQIIKLEAQKNNILFRDMVKDNG